MKDLLHQLGQKYNVKDVLVCVFIHDLVPRIHGHNWYSSWIHFHIHLTRDKQTTDMRNCPVTSRCLQECFRPHLESARFMKMTSQGFCA